MTFHISLSTIFLLSNSLMLAISLLVIIRFRREARAQLDFWESPIAASLLGEQRAAAGTERAADADKRVAQSLVRLEHQLLALRKDFMRNSVAAAAAGDSKQAPIVQQSSSLPIDNAVRMARHGASIEELTERCGLSPGEARLMQKLHGKPRTTH